MLNWANRFNIFCFLDNQDYSMQHHYHDCLLAAGAVNFTSSSNPADIDAFLGHHWAFGHLSYALKEVLHQQPSAKEDKIGFPPFFFFHPAVLCQLQGTRLSITAADPAAVYSEIEQTPAPELQPLQPLTILPKLDRDAYLEKVAALQQHIRRGDCYEINFCQEFFAEGAEIDPLTAFQRLTAVSPTPFSALYKLDSLYLVCASPERFLLKRDDQLYSQPMKGTIKRDLQDSGRDRQLKEMLYQSAKDRAENVMVVDLVRNDLSRICTDGSVRVNELYGIYSYPKVHQMISTVSGQLRPGTPFSEILSATFPMGSMTGAPKHRVMELIEAYEPSARGIFSGSVGYIDPQGNFDFNVVIRSIMYNASAKYLSYQVGSGITVYSDPVQEWEECLLKGEAIREVLEGSQPYLQNGASR
ncbi:MAG TPA: anthranilate synthase component I family protein [Flavisolibacter sp.]|nr:anthranilate synthase component I family protein [Flavisolibacter sp.]